MARKSRRKKKTSSRHDDPSLIWLRGLAAIGNEQWEEAISAFNQFREQITEPANQRVVYQNLAHCYTSLEQYDLALATLDKADAAWPDNLDTTYNRALTLAYAGRLEEAETLFKQIKKRWRCEARERDIKESLRIIQDIQKGKSLPGAYLVQHLAAKAEDNIEVGDFQLAEQKYRQIITLHPDDPEGHFGLGVALLEQGYPQEALHPLLQAHELEPDHAITLGNIGYTLLKLKRPDEASDWLQKAITFDPDYLRPYFQLGLAYEQLDQIEEAIHWWQTFRRKTADDYAVLEKLHQYGQGPAPEDPPPTAKTRELQRMIPLAKKQMRRPRRIRNGDILLTVDPQVGFVMEDRGNPRNASVYAGGPFETGTIKNRDMLDLMGIVKMHLISMNAKNTRSIHVLATYKNAPLFGYHARFNRKERVEFDSDGRFITMEMPTFFKIKVDSDIASPLGDPLQGLFIYVKDSPKTGTIVTTLGYSGAIR